MPSQGYRRHPRLRGRRGSTIVEVAIVLPIVLLLFYAQLNFSRANMILNTAAHAAYRGARKGIVPGTNVAKIEADVQSELAALSITDAIVTITPSVISDETPQVTVEVSVPLLPNLFATPTFLGTTTVVRSCTLTREQFYVTEVL